MSQEHQHVSKYHQHYFCQQLDQASNIGNINHPYYWHFVRGIRRWSMKYPHMGLVMRKLFNVMSSWPESRRQFALCCIFVEADFTHIFPWYITNTEEGGLLCFCSLWLYHQFRRSGIESINHFHWGCFSGMIDGLPQCRRSNLQGTEFTNTKMLLTKKLLAGCLVVVRWCSNISQSCPSILVESFLSLLTLVASTPGEHGYLVNKKRAISLLQRNKNPYVYLMQYTVYKWPDTNDTKSIVRSKS